MKQLIVLCVCSVTLVVSSCMESIPLPRLSPADSVAVLAENTSHRIEMEMFFRHDPGSPFVRDTTIAFTKLNWFPIDVRYQGRSILHRYDLPDTVTIYGTRGEPRRHLRYGYFIFPVPDSAGGALMIRLNVYKFTPSDGQRYALYRNHLNVWYTDATTGNETYHVGRYVDVGDENADPLAVYTIDLNKSYNPYCAYSSLYSCAIPSDEDHVTIRIPAGEMSYHH